MARLGPQSLTLKPLLYGITHITRIADTSFGFCGYTVYAVAVQQRRAWF